MKQFMDMEEALMEENEDLNKLGFSSWRKATKG
jgi:hypothetical protein